MLRVTLARCVILGSTLLLTGCGLFRNTCDDRPGFFDRFRLASNHRPVVISNGDCCDPGAMGPMLPPPGHVLPPPTPNIPRIDENGKQMPWDPKMGRNGTKTGNEVKTTKEGI